MAEEGERSKILMLFHRGVTQKAIKAETCASYHTLPLLHQRYSAKRTARTVNKTVRIKKPDTPGAPEHYEEAPSVSSLVEKKSFSRFTMREFIKDDVRARTCKNPQGQKGKNH